MKKQLFFLPLIFLAYQPAAYAYLDPGSGSMLVSALIGIIATLFFSMKGFYYKLKGLVLSVFGVKIEKSQHKLVFYSEGKFYWRTFKPVLEALDKQGIEALYLTSSDDDEGLNFNSKNITTRYIGEGNRAYTYLNMLEADVCVMTTPSLDVLQIRRSKGVKHYAYIAHSPIDMGKYKLYSFDCFDSIFLSGKHQEKSIRTLEELRNTPAKTLIEAGCPYMDSLGLRLEQEASTEPVIQKQPTILIAPTWGSNNLLKQVGTEPLKKLLDIGYDLIIRPHPQSYLAEPELLDKINKDLAAYPNLFWDKEPDSFNSLKKANLLISDLSGVVFDFAFVFEKPVITLQMDYDFIGQEANDLPYDIWELTVLDEIGKRLKVEDIHALPEIVQQQLETTENKEKLQKIRDASLYNYKQSGQVIAVQLVKIMEEVKS